jgi:DNA-binding transcriptional ArsR family regulator
MAGFSELIKTFEKTRDYIRDFFIYGCKARGEFVRKSSRTYDDEKRRAESWLGDVVRYDDSVRGRQVSISVDSGHIPENPLYQAYGAKSFTDNDIRLHFLLLDLLADGQPRDLNSITDALNEDYAMIFEPQTVRNKLREYTAEGVLITEKQGKTAFYRLAQDADIFDLTKHPALAEAVRFFSQDDAFGVIGAQILHANDLQNDIFLRKHQYIVHTLEDAILPEILEAIHKGCALHFSTFSAKARHEGGSFDGIPMQILVSVQTGRRYLAAYLPAQRRFHSFRLDFIREVKIGDAVPDYAALAETYRRTLSQVYGVSFGMRRAGETVEPLRLTVRADAETERYIIDRLNREKRIGTVAQTGENLYTLTVAAFDPNEIMHWAKTLIGRIVSIEGGTEEVRGRFFSDIRRMQTMYGGRQNDDLS